MSELYSNYQLLSQDGTVLAYIASKRRDWYLKKGLAEAVSDTAIRLLFKHKSAGAQPKIYAESREAICVVCGTVSDLTKHHVVPYSFKRYFPLIYKAHTSFDVVVLCEKCHNAYEKVANELKKDLFDQYNVASKLRPKEVGVASTLIKHGDRLPPIIRERLEKQLPEGVAESKTALIEYIQNFSYDKGNPHEEVVKSLASIEDFIILWRKHFVEVMQPQFLSQSWLDEIEFMYSNK